MSVQSFAKRCANTPVFRHFPRYAGLGIALVGLLSVAGWHAHWRPILQWVAGTAPMQYNTALCFVLSGAGLFLLTTRRADLAPWPAGTAAFFALSTLLQYFGGWNFGIDEMLLKPYFEVGTTYSGRMSPLAAVCFILIGLGVVLVGAKRKWPYRFTATAMLACTAEVIASVALTGFLFGMEPAYSWGSFSSMSVNTALLFSILGGGLLVWSWQTVRRENLNFLRWLPVTAAVTLMIMVTFVSLVNNRQLEIASYRLKHTVRVIFYTQSFEENLIDLQRGGLGQARPGDTNEFGSGQNGPNLEPEQFHRLLSLSSDNPGQEQLLKELAATMEQVFAHERRATALHPQPGFAATLESGPDAEGRKIFSRAHDILKAFSGEEQRSLDQGYVLEQAHAQSAARLLIFGSMLAAALLVAANYLVGREMNRRQRVEIEREKLIDELRRLLDEVKILSGMIPICGWCKSIRSDEGYWQTVEQYVREHTDATFTHGICPRCAEKLKAELHAASPSAVQ